MIMLQWTAVVLSFLAVLAAMAAFMFSPGAERRSLVRRIELQTGIGGGGTRTVRERGSLKDFLRNFSRAVAPKGLASRFEIDLVKADIPLKGEEGIMLWLGILVVPALLFFLLTWDAVGALMVMSLGLAVPFVILKTAAARRLTRFENQISGALIIIANSMRAGFSFLQALEMVGKEMGDPMASEVRRVLREMHLGMSTEQALINMGERVGSKDFDMVITAILIQRQIGGNLAEVLSNISGTIRSRIQLAGEVKVLTAQGRISGMLIGLLPVFLCFALYFVNKEYISLLFTDPRGVMMLAGGVAGEVIGMFLIKRIVDIKL